MSITAFVEEYVKSKPYLSTALSDGLINLTSLARQIKPKLDKELGKEVLIGSIVMALKRVSENMEFVSTHNIVKVLRRIKEINIRSSINDYCFAASPTLLKSHANYISSIEYQNENFYSFSYGVTESNIITSTNLSSLVERHFANEKMISKTDNLSSITFNLPPENISVSGIYYFIFQKLSWENINIHEVVSTSNEVILILDENNIEPCFRVINKLKKL